MNDRERNTQVALNTQAIQQIDKKVENLIDHFDKFEQRVIEKIDESFQSLSEEKSKLRKMIAGNGDQSGGLVGKQLIQDSKIETLTKECNDNKNNLKKLQYYLLGIGFFLIIEQIVFKLFT